MPHELINAQLPGRRGGRKRWRKGDTGAVELGGFGGSREAGWGVLTDLKKEALGWTDCTKMVPLPGPKARWPERALCRPSPRSSSQHWLWGSPFLFPWPSPKSFPLAHLSSPTLSLFHSEGSIGLVHLCLAPSFSLLPLP